MMSASVNHLTKAFSKGNCKENVKPSHTKACLPPSLQEFFLSSQGFTLERDSKCDSCVEKDLLSKHPVLRPCSYCLDKTSSDTLR